MKDYISEFNLLIQKTSSAVGRIINGAQYEVIDLGVPHTPKSLPVGKMGIYTFSFKDQFLKIGKAGPNSNARFLSQHYNHKSAKSTLAASILRDNDYNNHKITDKNIKEWIKQNCRRVDIIFDISLGVFTLEFVEAILHYNYEPKYEGFLSSNCTN